MITQEWKERVQVTLESSPELSTWQGHFEHRLSEIEEISEAWPSIKPGCVLEIGCGNGLAAALLSPLAGEITASDLEQVAHQSHSIGLQAAKQLMKKIGAKNVAVVGCSGEQLPFPSESFDLVYSLYALEHIPNKERCVQEVHRVLKPGGIALFSVPGLAWGLIYPWGFYTEFLSRVIKRLIGGRFKIGSDVNRTKAAMDPLPAPSVVVNSSTFRKAYPHFPFPEPHGAFASWPEEVHSYRPSSWRQLFRRNGFKEIAGSAISILPLSLFPMPIRRILFPADKVLCGKAPLFLAQFQLWKLKK